MSDKVYIAIDLKSFYASVECVDRGLDPLKTALVVADESRTEKTICLAVSPALKAYGIPGRPRLFEVVQAVTLVNAERRRNAPGMRFSGKSADCDELGADASLELEYIVAPPRMAKYMRVSSRIFQIYLRSIAPEDIYVYSVDEVFIDATHYLKTYRLTARALAEKLMREVLEETGITATAGIGTNLYLAKVAMDVEAKHIPPDERGARIAELNEESYRRRLWAHRPLTDFWRVGKGTAKKLEEQGIFTMGDIARCSLGGEFDSRNEALLYRLFGVNAELLIDHAWGYEPCTLKEIKAYRPEHNSIGCGQVLKDPYEPQKARLVLKEMADALALELVEKGLLTDQAVLDVGYDTQSLKGKTDYKGAVVLDRYGRRVPKPAHGSKPLEEYTSSTRRITDALTQIFDRIVDPDLLIRRMSISLSHVIPEGTQPVREVFTQLDLFTDHEAEEARRRAERENLKKERRIQQALIGLKRRYGKNAVVKGMDLSEGATAMERNAQIGGHKAGEENEE